MASFNVRDRVKVVEREPLPADAKNGLYYAYFGNLTGIVERVYDDNTLCIDVDIESLPHEIADRHVEMQTAARDKWIAGLSQEQRAKLTEQDKQFKMSYKVVVGVADVLPGGKGSPKSGKSASGESKKADTKVEGPNSSKSEAVKPDKAADSSAASAEQAIPAKTNKAQPALTTDEGSAPKRLTQKELDAKEQEFLNSLKSK